MIACQSISLYVVNPLESLCQSWNANAYKTYLNKCLSLSQALFLDSAITDPMFLGIASITLLFSYLWSFHFLSLVLLPSSSLYSMAFAKNKYNSLIHSIKLNTYCNMVYKDQTRKIACDMDRFSYTLGSFEYSLYYLIFINMRVYIWK